jgi:hypothetical protein
MKQSLFALAATLLVAPLAACGADTTTISAAELDTLDFPDDMEVIVWEPQGNTLPGHRTKPVDVMLQLEEDVSDSDDDFDIPRTSNTTSGHRTKPVDVMLQLEEDESDSDDDFDIPRTSNTTSGHQTRPEEVMLQLEDDSLVIPEPGANPDLPILEGEAAAGLDSPDDPVGAGDNTALDNPCMCDGPMCLQDWVDTNIGCDVCVAFTCGDSVRGACAVCPADEFLGN